MRSTGDYDWARSTGYHACCVEQLHGCMYIYIYMHQDPTGSKAALLSHYQGQPAARAHASPCGMLQAQQCKANVHAHAHAHSSPARLMKRPIPQVLCSQSPCHPALLLQYHCWCLDRNFAHVSLLRQAGAPGLLQAQGIVWRGHLLRLVSVHVLLPQVRWLGRYALWLGLAWNSCAACVG